MAGGGLPPELSDILTKQQTIIGKQVQIEVARDKRKKR